MTKEELMTWVRRWRSDSIEAIKQGIVLGSADNGEDAYREIRDLLKALPDEED